MHQLPGYFLRLIENFAWVVEGFGPWPANNRAGLHQIFWCTVWCVVVCVWHGMHASPSYTLTLSNACCLHVIDAWKLRVKYVVLPACQAAGGGIDGVYPGLGAGTRCDASAVFVFSFSASLLSGCSIGVVLSSAIFALKLGRIMNSSLPRVTVERCNLHCKVRRLS